MQQSGVSTQERKSQKIGIHMSMIGRMQTLSLKCAVTGRNVMQAHNRDRLLTILKASALCTTYKYGIFDAILYTLNNTLDMLTMFRCTKTINLHPHPHTIDKPHSLNIFILRSVPFNRPASSVSHSKKKKKTVTMAHTQAHARKKSETTDPT